MDKPKRSGRKSRRTFEIFLFLAVFLGIAVWQSTTRPVYFFLQSMSIEGNRRVATEEIQQMAGWDGLTLRVLWDGRPLLMALEGDVRVSEASVAYEWPGHLRVEIRERLAVATMLSEYGYIEIDPEGIVSIQYKILKKLSSPFVTGINAGRVFPGQRVYENKLFPLLRFLEALSPEARELVSEINVSNDAVYTLFLIDKARVRLGALDNPVAKARVLQDILRETGARKVPVDIIDLTHEKPVLRMKQK